MCSFLYTKDEIEYAIEQIVHDARHRALLQKRYNDKTTIERLAEEFEIEPRTVSDVLAKYRKDLEGFILWQRNRRESFY
jgi:hypothetical protein